MVGMKDKQNIYENAGIKTRRNNLDKQ